MKTKRHSLTLLLSLLIVCITASPAKGQDISNELKQQIDDLFQEYEGKPGASIGVFKNGKVLYNKSYGLANLDYDIPVSNTTVFEIGLTSQQFTAACIVLLENQGKLSFDDPIQKYLPEIPVYESGTITISQLLLHTSGLRDYLRLFFATGQPWDQHFDEAAALQVMSRQNGLSFTPGERAAPGDANFSLLAVIIRRITGMSMGEFAKKAIFTPLGMGNSLIYEDASAIIKNRATGYTDEGNGYAVDHYYNFTGGGNRRVYTTTEDFFHWNEALRNKTLGDDTFMDKMLTKGTLNNGDSLSWGFALDHGVYRGHKFYGYGGPWAGFASLFLRFPDEDLSAIVLTNNGTINVFQKTYELSALFLVPKEDTSGTSETASGASTTIKLSAKKQKAFTGTYFNYEAGYSREILFRNDSLMYARPDGIQDLLIPTGSNSFQIQALGQVLKVSFEQGSENSPSMFIDTNRGTPSEYVSYTAPDYSPTELQAFEGSYYCEDMDVTYHIKAEEGNLVSYIDDNPLLTWRPTMRAVFHDDHFGYLAFEKNSRGLYTSFTMNNSLGRLHFQKR